MKFFVAAFSLLALTAVITVGQSMPKPSNAVQGLPEQSCPSLNYDRARCVQGPPEPSCHSSNFDRTQCVHLSPAEARVVKSVAKASLSVKRRMLMYTKYEGVLLLYYQELQQGPCQNNAPICTSYWVLGSSNLSYAPYVNKDGPLPTGHLMAVVAGDVDFSCIGHFTRAAYARERVPTPWHNDNFMGVAPRKCYWDV